MSCLARAFPVPPALASRPLYGAKRDRGLLAVGFAARSSVRAGPRALIKSLGDADGSVFGTLLSNAAPARFDRKQGALWRSLGEYQGGPRMSEKFLPRFALIASVGALCLTFVPAASAAKGGGANNTTGGGGTSSTSSISGPVIVNDLNGNGLPNYGDTVTFKVSTTATTQPFVNLLCYQSGVLVYNTWRGFFAESLSLNWNFTLGSGGWTGGAADCTARLGKYVSATRYQVLASSSFHVDS